MSENDIDSVLQDYLDGRMSEADRTAFEKLEELSAPYATVNGMCRTGPTS